MLRTTRPRCTRRIRTRDRRAAFITDPLATGGLYSQILVTGAKSGEIYVINTSDMGKFDTNGDLVIQELGATASLHGSITSVFSSPAYSKGVVYFVGPGGVGQSFSIQDSILTKLANTTNTYGYPGATPTIADGMVFTTESSTQALYIDNANNFADMLWNSNQAAAGRDAMGSYQKFTSPVMTTELCSSRPETPSTLMGSFRKRRRPRLHRLRRRNR